MKYYIGRFKVKKGDFTFWEVFKFSIKEGQTNPKAVVIHAAATWYEGGCNEGEENSFEYPNELIAYAGLFPQYQEISEDAYSQLKLIQLEDSHAH